MTDSPYSKREIDLKMETLHQKLDLIIDQTTKTNGTVRRHTLILTGFGCVIGTLLIVNSSPFVSFLQTLIK